MGTPNSDITSSNRRRWSAGRVVLLAVTAVSLYLFFPSIAEVFSAWDKLGEVHPLALPVIFACEAMSFVCTWVVQRIALRTHEWFSISTSQLAGNSFNRVTPGGGATGTALQARMLIDAGFDGPKAAAGLTVQSFLMTAAVVAMPILAIPAIIAGTRVPNSLVDAAWIGALLFVAIVVLGVVLLATRKPLDRLGHVIETTANLFRFRRPPIHDLGPKLLDERDEIRVTMGSNWLAAVGASVGRWGFEYLALLVTLYAIDASPDPWLVLFAFVAASALGMIPFSPGGLGFVEAGMTASLAVSGVTVGQAVLATLVFRLVSFWLPIPIGIFAGWLFRRRYPRVLVAED